MVTDLKERFTFLDHILRPLNDDSVAYISVVCMVAMLIEFRKLIGIKIWVTLFSTKFCSYEG